MGSDPAFVFYALLVAGSVGTLSEVAGELLRAAGATERLLELLNTQPVIATPAAPVALPIPARGEVQFRDTPEAPVQPAAGQI